ncbi:L-rhamnose-binding lectin CSL1-like isoform 1-T1 [Salvelinus alpinus]|uniref:L-rhamnose-binding lectin CSL1-like isoform X1 n=1 Tax=Salvelinus alpinus TaxID=8036 RepID=UPI0039FB9321
MLLGQSILIAALQASLFLGYGMSEIQHRFLTCGDPSLQCDDGVIMVYGVKFSTIEKSSNESPKACSDTEAFSGVSKRCDGNGKCDVATSGSVCDLCNSAYQNNIFLDVTYGCLESKKVTTCEGAGVVHLECGDRVVFLQKALYGRTDSRTCSQGRPQSQLTNTKCSQEGTLALWSQRCDGKQMCEVNMRVNQISDPCYGTYKYLDVTYICLPAKTSITCEGSTSSLDCGVRERVNALWGLIRSSGTPATEPTNRDWRFPTPVWEYPLQCNDGLARLLPLPVLLHRSIPIGCPFYSGFTP